MITRCFQSSWETDLCPEGWKLFPFFQKRLICNPRMVFRMYRYGYYQRSFYVIFNKNMDLYFYFSLKSHLLQRLQTLRLIPSIKNRRKGKEMRGKEKTAYLWRDICIQHLPSFVWFSRWKKRPTPFSSSEMSL